MVLNSKSFGVYNSHATYAGMWTRSLLYLNLRFEAQHSFLSAQE